MTDCVTPTLLYMTIAVLVSVVMAQVRPHCKQMVPKKASLIRFKWNSGYSRNRTRVTAGDGKVLSRRGAKGAAMLAFAL